MNKRTWKIADIDGSNRREVTLAQFRAELDARKAAAAPIMDAWRSGDLNGVAKAQAAMTEQHDRPLKPLHSYCQDCGWRKGGPDSWDGLACKCGHSAPAMTPVLTDEEPTS